MPYIDEVRRINLREDGLEMVKPQNVGELNFCITDLIMNYLDGRQPSYELYNSIIGVLDCSKQEFYRRVLAPYEGNKMREAGDVYAR